MQSTARYFWPFGMAEYILKGAQMVTTVLVSTISNQVRSVGITIDNKTSLEWNFKQIEIGPGFVILSHFQFRR